jgi:PHD/YefM family antitoxin component YafN of YafNO toxin-antitoxin module
MTAVATATDFCRNFATWQRRAHREPVEVRHHDKPVGYYISAEDYERVQRILMASRRAYHPSELPEHLVKALDQGRMDPRHDHLNVLLDEE